MKKQFFLFFAFLPLITLGQEKIMVIADPHVLAQSLIEEGTAFNDMMAGQRKMIDLSQPAFMAIIDTALVHKPDLVLIPGDLTKDSEKASHELVVNQLKRLNEAGINTLVIPGNHDIGGNAYAYKGTQIVPVENITHASWEKMYDFVYKQVIAKDPNSHSYIAEPLPKVSILAIDGAHDNAGTGYLSDATLQWILTQADSANAKGNMIIAMCHWQLLEHVDKQETVMSSSQLSNAEAIRDSLMAHDVHVVLTGHMHINSISTYRDTTGVTNDSIVEISTGSPITYPCPYRWITVSKDRSKISVYTNQLNTLAKQNDLQSYSREWMRMHTSNMIPQLTLRAFGKVDQLLDMIRDNAMIGGEVLAYMLEQSLPTTDSAKIDLVQRHLGSTLVELYLLHSDANEPENPKADSLTQALYDGMDSIMTEITSGSIWKYSEFKEVLFAGVKLIAKEPVQSLVEDKTHVFSNLYSDRTDDINVELTINEAIDIQAVETIIPQQTTGTFYDIMGRAISQPTQRGVYIQNGKKVIR